MSVKSEYLTIRVPQKVKRDITNIAVSEDRSVSNVAHRLLLKGLLYEYKEEANETRKSGR
jgi:hypothetical protein